MNGGEEEKTEEEKLSGEKKNEAEIKKWKKKTKKEKN